MRDDREIADIVYGRIHGARISTRVQGRQAVAASGRNPSPEGLFGRDRLLGQERLEQHRLAGSSDQRVAGRHRLPMRTVGVEWLRDDHHIAGGFPIIERIGLVVGGVAERVEVAAISERRREPQWILVVLGGDHVGDGRHHPLGGSDRVSVAAGAQDGEEDRFRIGGADAGGVDGVGDQGFDLAPQPRPVADHAVMHEQPAPAGEGVAVRPRDRRPGRGPYMGEVQVRADVPAEIAQVLVGPGRADLPVKARLGMLAVPAHAEAVAVGRRGRFQRALALDHQRMRGGGHVLFQRDGFAAIGNPAAHRRALSLLSACSRARLVPSPADAAKPWQARLAALIWTSFLHHAIAAGWRRGSWEQGGDWALSGEMPQCRP